MSSSELFLTPHELNGMSGANGHSSVVATNGLSAAQPGSSKTLASLSQTNGTKVVLDYVSDFPELPGAKAATSAQATAPVTNYRPLTLAVVTSTLKLSAADRAALGNQKSFGRAEQESCAKVSAATNTKIELHESSDKSLTILITGKKANVQDAQSRLVIELQTQGKIEIVIDKEFYGALIGKEGAKRKQFEQEFLCRLYLPGRDENSNVVRIVGPIDKVKQAAFRLKSIVNELSKQATETLEIPRAYYPWIKGPFNETLESIQTENNIRVNIPPPKAKSESIVISGEREGVVKATQRVKAIYEEMRNNVKSLTVNVARSQHRFITGHQRSGLDEIFKETNVIVELPPEDEESDAVTLRGPQSRLGDALTKVYARASSIVSKELTYPEWQRRFLLGPKGATLQQLVPKQDRLQVEFEDGGKIFIEGPPKAVENAHVALSTEIARLSKEMASEIINVPLHLHRHLIGKQGAGISKIKDEYDVQITIPNKSLESELIRIEGNKQGVEKAVAELKDQVAKLKKKMPTKEAEDKQIAEQKKIQEERRLRSFKVSLDVPRSCHQVVIGKGGATISELSSRFDVHVSIPRDESETITITGYEKKANEAKEAIAKIVADYELQQEDRRLRSYKTSVDVPLEYHQRLIGPGGATVRELSKRFDVHVSIPRDESETITISGYEGKAEQAKTEIERLISDYQNMVTHEIDLHPNFHPRIIGQRGKNLRKLQDDYKVEIKMPSRQDENPSRVLVSGVNEDKIIDCIEKLRSLEDEYMEEFASHAQYEYKRPKPEKDHAKPQHVEITGAPWQLNSLEQFPSMGGDNGDATPQQNSRPAGVWGRRR